jgi:hypothetical protein
MSSVWCEVPRVSFHYLFIGTTRVGTRFDWADSMSVIVDGRLLGLTRAARYGDMYFVAVF